MQTQLLSDVSPLAAGDEYGALLARQFGKAVDIGALALCAATAVPALPRPAPSVLSGQVCPRGSGSGRHVRLGVAEDGICGVHFAHNLMLLEGLGCARSLPSTAVYSIFSYCRIISLSNGQRIKSTLYMRIGVIVPVFLRFKLEALLRYNKSDEELNILWYCTLCKDHSQHP